MPLNSFGSGPLICSIDLYSASNPPCLEYFERLSVESPLAGLLPPLRLSCTVAFIIELWFEISSNISLIVDYRF